MFQIMCSWIFFLNVFPRVTGKVEMMVKEKQFS